MKFEAYFVMENDRDFHENYPRKQFTRKTNRENL